LYLVGHFHILYHDARKYEYQVGLSFDKIFTATNVQRGKVINTISNLYKTFTISGIYRIGRLKGYRNKGKAASPKECDAQAIAIKDITSVQKYVNKEIILLFTALNTVKGKIDVIPERNGNINSWIRAERTGFKVQTLLQK
jgi:hypothetical protein